MPPLLTTDSPQFLTTGTGSGLEVPTGSGAYWLLIDAEGLGPEQGYLPIQNAIDAAAARAKPAGVIVKNAGPSHASGERLWDGLLRAIEEQPYYGGYVTDLGSWGLWRTDKTRPIRPRNLGGGDFPVWFWGGGFTPTLQTESINHPQHVARRLEKVLWELSRVGIDGVLLRSNRDAATSLPGETVSRWRREETRLRVQRLAHDSPYMMIGSQGWPSEDATQWIGSPVFLTPDESVQHPAWPGHVAQPGDMAVDQVGPVLIGMPEDIGEFFTSASRAFDIGASIAVPWTVWMDPAFPAIPEQRLQLDATVTSVTVTSGLTTMEVSPLTTREEIERLYGEAGFDLLIDDLPDASATEIINEAIREATEYIFMYLGSRFTSASIATQQTLHAMATRAAAYRLSQRRGNPAIAAFEQQVEDDRQMLQELSNGENTNLRLPGLVEIEGMGLATINFRNQAGPFPVGEPIRVDPASSTNVFDTVRGSRSTVWPGSGNVLR